MKPGFMSHAIPQPRPTLEQVWREVQWNLTTVKKINIQPFIKALTLKPINWFDLKAKK